MYINRIHSKNANEMTMGMTSRDKVYRIMASIVALCFAAGGYSQDFAKGADISWVTEMESRGAKFYDRDDKEADCFDAMKSFGLNAIRLRVWVDPSRHGGWCDKNDVLQKALRAKKAGMDVMIDFHYSDWWADPGKQNIPAAWKGYDYKSMKKAVAEHTAEVLTLLKKNGVNPKWVQVGNETSNGMLWDMGRATTNPEQYAGFVRAGYDAVKKVFKKAIVIVHLDNGFDPKLYDWNLGLLIQHGAKFDMIGMSLYPYWAMDAKKEPSADKTISDCMNNLRRVAEKFDRDVMIVETGFLVDESNPSVMEEGREQLARIIREARTETNGRCRGVIYWEPECKPRQYKLGAYTNDGHPTAIMYGFEE